MSRVLCLTSWYPPHHYGGYEAGCYDVMTRLEARGHHVEVLCGDERHDGAVVVAPDHEARVHRTLQLYFRDDALWSPPLRTRLAVERANLRALDRALASCRPDVVSVWHVGAMSLGLVRTLLDRGIPVVFDIQDNWPNYAAHLDQWLRPLRRWPRPLAAALERATGVPSTVPDLDRGGACFISRTTRDQVRRGSRWSFPRSGVVYSGIDRERFRPPADRPAGGGGWGGRLLYVGRLDRRKGIDALLRAAALVPAAGVAVVGRGADAEQDRLRALADELGLAGRVTFSHAAREELAAIYADADVCVFPSEWPEPFGLVPFEAMACGTPVVATGTGGSDEFLVDGVNCLRFPPGDHDALAAAVRRLASDADLRAHLLAGGLRTAEVFDVDHVADELERWHAAAVAGYPDGPPPDRVVDLGSP